MSDNIRKFGDWPMNLHDAKKATCKTQVIVKTDDGPMVIHVGISYLQGNTSARWSITARGRGFGGCCHDEILKHRPDLKQFVDLHLCSYDGIPMHGAANLAYYLKGYFKTRYAMSKGFDEKAKATLDDLRERNISPELRAQLEAEMSKSVPAVMPEYLSGAYGIIPRKEKVDELVEQILEKILTVDGVSVDPEGHGRPGFIDKAVKEFMESESTFLLNRARSAWGALVNLANAPKEKITTIYDWMKANNVKVEKYVDYTGKTEEERETWPDHVKNRITLTRGDTKYEYPVFGSNVTIDRAVQILCEEAEMGRNYASFKDYCAELGFDSDSRRAKAGHDALLKFSEEVFAIFTAEEIAEMKDLCEDTANLG